MISASIISAFGFAAGLAGIWLAGTHVRGESALARVPAVLMIVVGFMAAASGAQSVVPVISGAQFEVWQHKPGRIVGTMWADKWRACELVSTHVQVVRGGKDQFDASLSFVAARNPGQSRPTGWQQFGRWEIEYDKEAEPVRAILLEARHDCGRLLQITRTRVVMPIT